MTTETELRESYELSDKGIITAILLRHKDADTFDDYSKASKEILAWHQAVVREEVLKALDLLWWACKEDHDQSLGKYFVSAANEIRESLNKE